MIIINAYYPLIEMYSYSLITEHDSYVAKPEKLPLKFLRFSLIKENTKRNIGSVNLNANYRNSVIST